MKQMFKQHGKKLLLSSALILSPILFGLLFYNQLPNMMNIHWGAGGTADGQLGKAFAIFLLPLLLLLIHLLALSITMFDPRQQNQGKKTQNLVLWIIPVLSLIVNGMMYVSSLGYTPDMSLFLNLVLGLTFLVIGNMMPKIRQNYTLGIKIKWTLESEQNWNATHRFCGKVWVLCGLLMLVCGFIPKWGILAGMCITLAGVIAPMVYSYCFYKKHKNSGEETATTPMEPFMKKYRKISIIMATVILLFCLLIMFIGSIGFELKDDSLTINASYWQDITVKYKDITQIEYLENDQKGHRVSGFGSAKLLMGAFTNDTLGNFTRYSYTQCDSGILLQTTHGVLVISDKTEQDTQALYQKLQQKL